MGEIAVFCSGLALRGLWSLVEKGGADLLGWVMYPHHEIYYAFIYILIMSCSHRESKLHSFDSILLLCYYVNNEIFSIIMHHVT